MNETPSDSPTPIAYNGMRFGSSRPFRRDVGI